MTPRERIERWEAEFLSPHAAQAARSRGREVPEPPDDLRTDFQRDRDRVLHAKAFRRLMHKTQVFIAPEGDHYRTRLTHTLEVSQIARTIARALRANEDLTEAIVLAHDLGHPPFGHAGEEALDRLLRPLGGFRHYEQSLRVVEVLERRRRSDGTVTRGLNLTWEVRDGIAGHSKGRADVTATHGEGLPSTLEGQVVRLADRIAYLHHDTDDAVRAGLLDEREIPDAIRAVLGRTRGAWLDAMVRDVVDRSEDRPAPAMSAEVLDAQNALKDVLFERVYHNPVAKREVGRAQRTLDALFLYAAAHPDELPLEAREDLEAGVPIERAVADHLAGMTDRFAIREFERLFVPRAWSEP